MRAEQQKHMQFMNCLRCGNIAMQPYVVLKNDHEIHPEYHVTVFEKSRSVRLLATEECLFQDELFLRYKEGEIICRRTFQNLSGECLALKELAVELGGISFDAPLGEDYYYHNENPRIYGVMTLPVDLADKEASAMDSEFDEVAGNRWDDPRVACERVGNSPYQPFPAVLLSNYEAAYGLVHGTLSQKVFYHNYLIRHVADALQMKVYSSFMGSGYLAMSPGRVLTDEWYLGRTDEAANVERIFAAYADVLRKKLPAGYGRANLNRDQIVWGSWNDGVGWDVSEELVLREASYIKEHFPTVQWMQLDVGYSAQKELLHGLGVYYEGENGIDKEKFPHGLRYLADRIREIGLRPAIWIGGYCLSRAPLFRDRPEWFLDYSFRANIHPMDVSQEAVRDYMCQALRALCEDNGFEAIKHDFWSYAFEDSHDMYQNHDKSGYEYRSWWLKELRSVIPTDGYLEACCDIGLGNPFLGEYFSNYRYGPDIAAGSWETLKKAYLYGMACFATHTGDLYIPNSDAIGLLPGLCEKEAMFCINYCLVTHSMVEIAGQLSQSKRYDRLKILKKATCNPNNGQDIYFARYDYRVKAGFHVPEILYFKTPHFSRLEDCKYLPIRTVGIFNLDEYGKEYTFAPEDLGLPADSYLLTDVWTGEQYKFQNLLRLKVEAHESRLLAVNTCGPVQLYDANIRINGVEVRNDICTLETDYGLKEIKLSFSERVKAVRFQGEPIPFETGRDGREIYFHTEKAGTLEVELDLA